MLSVETGCRCEGSTVDAQHKNQIAENLLTEGKIKQYIEYKKVAAAKGCACPGETEAT